MREYGYINKKFSGDKIAAQQRTSIGRVLLGQLKNRMQLLGLDQLVWRRKMGDGAIYVVSSIKGIDRVHIFFPLFPGGEEFKGCFHGVGLSFESLPGGSVTFVSEFNEDGTPASVQPPHAGAYYILYQRNNEEVDDMGRRYNNEWINSAQANDWYGVNPPTRTLWWPIVSGASTSANRYEYFTGQDRKIYSGTCILARVPLNNEAWGEADPQVLVSAAIRVFNAGTDTEQSMLVAVVGSGNFVSGIEYAVIYQPVREIDPDDPLNEEGDPLNEDWYEAETNPGGWRVLGAFSMPDSADWDIYSDWVDTVNIIPRHPFYFSGSGNKCVAAINANHYTGTVSSPLVHEYYAGYMEVLLTDEGISISVVQQVMLAEEHPNDIGCRWVSRTAWGDGENYPWGFRDIQQLYKDVDPIVGTFAYVAADYIDENLQLLKIVQSSLSYDYTRDRTFNALGPVGPSKGCNYTATVDRRDEKSEYVKIEYVMPSGARFTQLELTEEVLNVVATIQRFHTVSGKCPEHWTGTFQENLDIDEHVGWMLDGDLRKDMIAFIQTEYDFTLFNEKTYDVYGMPEFPSSSPWTSDRSASIVVNAFVYHDGQQNALNLSNVCRDIDSITVNLSGVDTGTDYPDFPLPAVCGYSPQSAEDWPAESDYPRQYVYETERSPSGILSTLYPNLIARALVDRNNDLFVKYLGNWELGYDAQAGAWIQSLVAENTHHVRNSITGTDLLEEYTYLNEPEKEDFSIHLY